MHRVMGKMAGMSRRRHEDWRRRRQNHGKAADVPIGAGDAGKVGELWDWHHAERRLAGDGSRGIGSRHRGSDGKHKGGKLCFHEASPVKVGRPIAADRSHDGQGRDLSLPRWISDFGVSP